MTMKSTVSTIAKSMIILDENDAMHQIKVSLQDSD